MQESISVGSRVITPHDVGLEAQYHPAASWEAAYHQAQRALVVRELLLLECEARGALTARPEDERAAQNAIDALLEQALPKPSLDEAACRAFYDEHPSRFVGAPLYDASHILLGAKPTDLPARELARRRADALRVELLDKPELFERRAREVSACPSAGNDGRLGQISLGDTEPTFEAALLGLEPGQLSEVVETKNGYHLIRLEARADGQRLPYELVEARIRLYVEERAFRAQLHALVLSLAEKYGVKGFDLESAPPTPSPPSAKQRGPRRLQVLHG